MADHNIWKHVKVDPDSIKNNPYLNPVQPSTSPPIVEPPTSYQSTTPLVGIYSTIEGNTYANAVHELQDSLRSNPSQAHPIFISSSGTKLFRPLTYKENIEARINDFETKKNPESLSKVKFEKFSERLSAQIMHLGPYGAAEAPTVEKLHDFIEKSGYKIRDKHHEIYISDVRRTKPERLKTVIRQPIEQK